MKPKPLTAGDFSAFFSELWEGHAPFPWQLEFARRLCAGEAPDYVAVPTGSGKTACLDAAVFALAVQASMPVAKRTQGRRVFFIINRRVIVDEAYERAGKLCEALKNPSPDSTVGRVAAALHTLCGESDDAPLARAQLRGGIYRDRSWASSLVQPMIICSTVDQAGSRLLFRGYGVSPQARPIHAALVAHDSLLIIDEAHISRPFIQTLQWVEKYRRHESAGTETVGLPFQFIQMTATLPTEAREEEKITLSPADHDHPVLKPRLQRAKPAQLVVESKAKGKVRDEQMAKRLTEEAVKILSENPPRSIAIMVNRVATARSVAERMEKANKGRVSLLIGRLRPLDREAVTKEIQKRLKTGTVASAVEQLIVVSTQCLEVGADLDFDALVTEAASLDALRQRFGRLNRGGRDIVARGVIVLPGDQELSLDKLDDAAPCDPIYGNAIPRTWEWLKSIAKDDVVDFGINAMSDAVDNLRAKHPETLTALLSPTKNAPVLLPAYLDCWAQTNPAPAVEPEVALFLHGPQRDMTEVQVCWRGDLPNAHDKDAWADTLSLCPPTATECLPIPLHVFRDWLITPDKFEDSSGDVADFQRVDEKKKTEEARKIDALVWRSPEEKFWAESEGHLRPGDTIVLRVQSGGWDVLGHLPSAPNDPQTSPKTTLSYEDVRRLDVAEIAATIARRRAIFRVHSAFWPEPPAGSPAALLFELAKNPDIEWHVSEITNLLKNLLDNETPGWAFTDEQRETVEHLTAKGRCLSVERYPDNRGFVFSTPDLLPISDLDQIGDTDPDSLLEAPQPQELWSHTNDVVARLKEALALLPLTRWREALIAAATMHDWGKADPRFQALLRGTTPFAAMASESFLAKSGSIPTSAAARSAARERAELPGGFRHEMLSLQMALSPAAKAFIPEDALLAISALHLVASHHGYARPFAAVVTDESPPNVHVTTQHGMVRIAGLERNSPPPHRIDSGIADRFWELTRVLGWWGLPYLEAVLRLADQRASEIAPNRRSIHPTAALAPS